MFTVNGDRTVHAPLFSEGVKRNPTRPLLILTYIALWML